MYKCVKLSLFLILVLFSCFVFAQESPKTAPLPSTISQQQVADVVHKVMTEQKKDTIEDINKHMDENFGQLDARIISNNKILFRKAIFSLLGGMTVILVGYAFLINRVSKQYDINFYEKMIESKINSLNVKLPGHLYFDTIYKPVTYTDDRLSERFESPEHYFDDISSKQEISREQYMKIKDDLVDEMRKISTKHKQKKIIKELERKVKPLKEHKKFNKKIFIYILLAVLLISVLGVYVYFKYFRTVAEVTGGV